jgi:hypothetical protein
MKSRNKDFINLFIYIMIICIKYILKHFNQYFFFPLKHKLISFVSV